MLKLGLTGAFQIYTINLIKSYEYQYPVSNADPQQDKAWIYYFFGRYPRYKADKSQFLLLKYLKRLSFIHPQTSLNNQNSGSFHDNYMELIRPKWYVSVQVRSKSTL